MIPAEWSAELAEDVCSQISVGIVVTPAAYYVDAYHGVRAFRSANVREGYVNDRDWVYISQEGHKKNKKSTLRAGDVLIVRTGYPGTACVLPTSYDGSNCIDIIFARPKGARIISAYLCEFTNSEFGKKQVLDGQGGLAQKHFNVGAYKKLKIPVPPLPEQRRIAEILSTWDRAIETVEALIANARAHKAALMQQLLTGKQRLPGFKEEWTRTTLRRVALITYGTSPKRIIVKDGAYPIIGTGGYVGRTNQKIGDGPAIIIGRKGTIDRPMLVEGPFWAIDTTYFCKPDANNNAYWLFYFFQSVDLASMSESSGLPSLSRETLYSLPVLLPPVREQVSIGAVLRVADEYCDTLGDELAALRREKAALMQQLLTGKRRVRLDEAASA